MLKTLLKLMVYIDKKYQYKLVGAILLLTINAATEILAIASAVPFLAALNSPDWIIGNDYLDTLIKKLNLTSPNEILIFLAIVFIILITFALIMRLISLRVNTYISFWIGADIAKKMYSNVLWQPFSFHIDISSSRLLNTILIGSDRILTVFNSILIIITSTIILISILCLMLYINFEVTVVGVLGFGMSYYLVATLTKTKLIAANEVVNSTTVSQIKLLQESFSGVREVMVNGSENAYIKIFGEYELKKRIALAKNIILSNYPKLFIESTSMIFLILIALYLYLASDDKVLIMPILGVIAITAQRLLPLMHNLYSGWTGIKANLAFIEEAIFMLELPNMRIDNYRASNKPLIFSKFLELRDVRFSYKSSSNTVLNKINLKISKGARVGFIGSSGSGKSTLIDLLMGLLQPDQGVLLVDDIIINNSNQLDWLRKIAHVPQEVFLSDASIAENIAFGLEKDQIDYSVVSDSAKRANIELEILNLEQGYETVVGERGIRLSGGQKQRIAIARALYRKAEILVFDEATSALDNETENYVIESLGLIEREITILMIAHRISSLKSCDEIYEIEGTTISGPYSYKQIILKYNPLT
jgi:ABC-type multidrug transport system fused ATPase/permease subunit